MAKILIVQDDVELASTISKYLEVMRTNQPILRIRTQIHITIIIASILCLSVQSGQAQSNPFFDGHQFDLKKLADADAASSDQIPKSAKVWMKLETLYHDANDNDSPKDTQLLARIKDDQDTTKIISIENIWTLFSNRMVERRYSDARSCISLAETLLENVPQDSLASKTLEKNKLRLERATKSKHSESVRHGQVTLSNIAGAYNSGVTDGARDIAKDTAWNRPRGYTGIRVIDGKVDSLIKYSPAQKSAAIKENDEIISLNGLLLKDCPTKDCWRLCNGNESEIIHIIYKHAGQEKAVEIVSQKYPSLENLESLTAQQRYELGSQLRELGSMSSARMALESAAAMSPDDKYSILATKALRSRLRKYNPPQRCMDIYMRAFFGNFDHEEMKAEALSRYCISEWPQFEWPYRQLAYLLLDEKRLHEAESVAHQLVIVNPDYARGWKVFAAVKDALGDKNGAKECRHKARELDPDDT